MSNSLAESADLGLSSATVDLPAWKSSISGVAALLLAILFFASGAWKLTDPFQWARALTEFKVQAAYSLPLTITLGVGETLSAVLVLVPRFRRWGSWLIALMLVTFMLYIGANYSALAGKECSCFPIVKRTIGPGFFLGDGLMLLMAVITGWWTRPSENLRAALVVLGAVAVFAGVSFGANAVRQTGLKAPESITVDGQPFSLQQGEIFLFFYDPECMHCDAAARRMAKLNWKNTKVIAIPTHDNQFAAAFLHDTGLQAGTSFDLKLLRGTFQFVDPPFGVALERGHQKAVVASFEDAEPAQTLRRIGFIE
ncbi:MAG TPA: MauE/DoxX family redox-associated membrane protein [Bryobacteraceae bacterium]|nr:MauE/DoxX family redox-associated membrane protein [Bryobacteraceae bacterium]